MKTYQDLLAIGESDEARMDFVRQVINDHKGSDLYKIAQIAEDYFKQRNTTITNYVKTLYNLQGKPVEDLWSANYKLASNFFKRFVTQENQFLLGNGITWGKDDTKEKLGDDFDTQVQKAGRSALCGAVSFGFWNYNRLLVFDVNEFAPLLDEEDGAIKAGVRFWQIDAQKPLRATLYELDGYTDYIWKKQEGSILNPKRKYIELTRTTEADGTEIYDSMNYPTFPIVPLWGNPQHQSEIVGVRAKIDAYDLIESGFADDLDTAQIYWILHNTGGMEDSDLAQFIERLHIVHAATVDDAAGTAVDSHTVDIPYESREKLLERLKNDLYKDYMALDTDSIASGAVTATQIEAAYEPLNSKADEYEYCVLEFIKGITELAGIDDTPTFTRSKMVNKQEEVQTLVQAASYLPEDYITRRIMTIFGDAELVDDVLAEMDAENIQRLSGVNIPEEQENASTAQNTANNG